MRKEFVVVVDVEPGDIGLGLGLCFFGIFVTLACFFSHGCCLVINTSAVNCAEKVAFELTYYILNGMLNSPFSLVDCFWLMQGFFL